MPYGFFYGLEIAAVVTITLLGILVNSLLGKKYIFLVLFQHFQKKKERIKMRIMLPKWFFSWIFFLVHGTLQASDHFILPWLIFHVPLIIGLFCAFVCIIILLHPIIYRAFGVIPMVFGVYLLWAWIKVKSEYYITYVHMYLRKWNSNFALPLISELQQNRNIIYCFCDSCVSLDRHNKCVHLKIKRFMCTICTKGFITKDGLISHKRKEHQSDSPEQSTCFICNSRFLNKFALKSHFRTNHKNGICNQCGKRFKNLKQHFIQVHNKSFTCDTCKKQFGRRNSLDIHVRTVHENDKPHKCDQCEKSFGENSVSQTHMKIVHENIKPFKCDTCSKAFGTKGGLIRHNNEIHENKNRIKCHLCKNT